MQLLASLRYYATASFLQVLGDRHGLSKLYKCCVQSCTSSHLCTASTCGRTHPISSIKTGHVRHLGVFLKHYHIPQVIGVIDVALIPISTPSVDGRTFICRKSYSAINCQVICDHKCLFTDIVARWPDSTHDSYIFTNFSEGQEVQNLKGYWSLLGDSGYIEAISVHPCC